jgi:excinuclease ABC subunit A
MAEERSLTGAYLSGATKHPDPGTGHAPDDGRQLRCVGASGNNLQTVDRGHPRRPLTCITGVSGSGKSTLINGTLYPLAATALNGATT